MTDRVVVTGGGGFIGSHLTEALLGRGAHVTVVESGVTRNLEEAADHPNLRLVEADVRDPDAVAAAIVAGVDTVFHLAAVVGVKHYIEDPFRVIDINVGGTRNVLRAAVDAGARVVLSSTSEVYGRNPRVPWSEDDDRVLGSTTVDRWSYSSSKAIAEHMAFAVHHTHGLPVTVVRYFNAYGPRQAPHYVISQSVYKALRSEPPLLYDGGRQTRCFTYVGDAIAGTLAAADHEDAAGEVFNIGNATETTIRDAIEIVLKVAGADVGWQDLDTSHHYGDKYEDIDRRIPEVSKAKQLLGWEAETSLEDGVGRTIEWAQQHEWWLR